MQKPIGDHLMDDLDSTARSTGSYGAQKKEQFFSLAQIARLLFIFKKARFKFGCGNQKSVLFTLARLQSFGITKTGM